MENAIRHNKTPEERKAALEEALRRVRPVVLGHNEPVGKRLEQFANRPIDEQTKTSDRKKALRPLSLAEMAKKGTELEKKAEKAGIDLKGPGLAKDIEEKNKEKNKRSGGICCFYMVIFPVIFCHYFPTANLGEIILTIISNLYGIHIVQNIWIFLINRNFNFKCLELKHIRRSFNNKFSGQNNLLRNSYHAYLNFNHYLI